MDTVPKSIKKLFEENTSPAVKTIVNKLFKYADTAAKNAITSKKEKLFVILKDTMSKEDIETKLKKKVIMRYTIAALAVGLVLAFMVMMLYRVSNFLFNSFSSFIFKNEIVQTSSGGT